MAKEALFIIDMLNDFVKKDAPLEVPVARVIIPNIQKRIREARERGAMIFYICDAHNLNDKEFAKWPHHALKGTKGAEIIEELKPGVGAPVILKNRYSGFLDTPLAKILKAYGIRKIYITGILTNICVFFTAAEASMRNYEVVVCADSVAAMSEKDRETALDQLERVLKIEVIR